MLRLRAAQSGGPVKAAYVPGQGADWMPQGGPCGTHLGRMTCDELNRPRRPAVALRDVWRFADG